jgi:peptide/nickel transport system substrate-binding protein
MEGVPFDAHALGRPKIERIRVIWVPDFNATLANMLAGEAHITIDDSIRFQQGLILRREWTPHNAGAILLYPSLWRWTQIQQRPQYANPSILTDPRVRKALAYTVDKEALNGALFEGEGILAENPVAPNADYFAEVDRTATKYPYDARRSEQFMAEAGFRKGSDGIYVGPPGTRFSTSLAVLQSPQNESEMSIMASTWRQAGFDVRELVWAAAQARDGQLRNTHPGLSTTSGPAGDGTLADHISTEIPRPENRWSGSNRGGWSNPEFDRLAETFNTTLDRGERVHLLVGMARVFSEDAAVISLYFNPTVTAFVSGLTGPRPVVPTSDVAWDVQQWEFR